MGACGVCGWQIVHSPQAVMRCRCTIARYRATVPDGKLRAAYREWDELAEESRRADQERQERGEPPLGALLILAPHCGRLERVFERLAVWKATSPDGPHFDPSSPFSAH